MKSRAEFYQELLEMIQEKPEEYREDYFRLKEIEKDSEAYYDGELVSFLYVPCVIREEEFEDLKLLVEEASGLFNHVIDLYREHEDFRKLFGFPKKIEELILLDSPLPIKFPMARMDIFYRGLGDYTFCEINTDGSSAMNEDRVLCELFEDSLLYRDLKDKGYEMTSFELFSSWVDTIYRYWEEERAPVVAILDTDVDKDEFRRYARHFEERGAKVFLVTPWDLKLKEGYLAYQDEKIDLVYRRLVTTDLLKIYDEVPELIQGIKEGKTLFFGPIASQVIHNKVLFSVLHDERSQRYFSEKQRQWIKAHIPFTAPVDERVVADQHYVYEKDRYLLKPMDSYAARGIFVGKKESEADWKGLLEAFSNRDYLIQAFAELPAYEAMDFELGRVNTFHQLMGIFVYDGELKGFFTRSGARLVVAGHEEGKSQGSLLFKKTS